VNAEGPARALARAPAAASSRSLSTARSVLRVLALLVERPGGIRADEVAARLGKSTSTAYYLLSSLCEEGFAVHAAKGLYRPARGLDEFTALTAPPTPVSDALSASVQELFTLTRRRSYLGIVRGGRIQIVAIRGRQGVPRMPGLGTEIREGLHALAMGKIVLAQLDGEALAQYAADGLPAFTSHTITSPSQLAAELAHVRADGYAVEREEFDENFCCVAAPIREERGHFAAVLGLSMTATVFDSERAGLVEIIAAVAARAVAPPRFDTGARDHAGPRRRLAAIS
jgi:DNA-binding IclR family transcriptional regulator